jgi:magnesium chelatase family protein
MGWYSYAAVGYDGKVVTIEVDIRRGIPGMEIVGLPGSAVKEARERIRIAIRNSGLQFPRDRILVNLAPADLPKAGSAYDLPIALAILEASGQIPVQDEQDYLVLGELLLSGMIRPVQGALAAITAGFEKSLSNFFVPKENLQEARALEKGSVFGLGSLTEAIHVFNLISRNEIEPEQISPLKPVVRRTGDFKDMGGQEFLKRAVQVAVAGRHHMLMFGPPGGGKTMAAMRIPSILPELSREEALSVTRIHSIAGILPSDMGLIRERPFRAPHHSASLEGIIGGGKRMSPGEISLAHTGTLFLDEAPEFKRNILQSLREPMEEGRVSVVRAGVRSWYPSDFQLVLAANPCPCGNLGKDEGICFCGQDELFRYWRKIGGAFLDRIDIRFPVVPSGRDVIGRQCGKASAELREQILVAGEIQKRRYSKIAPCWNSRIPVNVMREVCGISGENETLISEAAAKLHLSNRAIVAVLKVARTIADLDRSANIGKNHILEAIQYRRYGDGDYLWSGD